MDRSRRARFLLSLGSGLGLALAFPNFLPAVPLFAWFALGLLMEASFGARPRLAFACGLVHGLVFHFLTLPWIYNVLREYGRLGAFASVGVLALMVLVLALFPAIFAATMAYLAQKSVARACLAAPFVWVTCEYAQTHMPSIGFPWNLTGYAASGNLGLVQLTTLTGIYGLSFLVVGYNALIAWARVSLRRGSLRGARAWLIATVVLVAAMLIGPRLVPAAPATQVAHLVQLNFPQLTEYDPRWMEQHAADLGEVELLSLTAAETAPGLIVWPESSAPLYLRDPQFAAQAAQLAVQSRSYFLLGVVDWKRAENRWEGPYNSAALLDPVGRTVFVYDKIHLVAFGEYVPWQSLLRFAGQLVAEVGGFKAGREVRVGELPDVPGPAEFRMAGPPHKFGAFICFEAIFPALVRQFAAQGGELFINISNDGWYGRTAGPEQHLQMARVRAVENRRWMLRATNNGFTVAVDPYGRIVARLESDRRGVLAAPYAFRSDRTIYTRFGDWFAWLAVIAAAAFVVWEWKERASAGRAKLRT